MKTDYVKFFQALKFLKIKNFIKLMGKLKNLKILDECSQKITYYPINAINFQKSLKILKNLKYQFQVGIDQISRQRSHHGVASAIGRYALTIMKQVVRVILLGDHIINKIAIFRALCKLN